ncbi:hypothetical protein EK904_004934 [Melospiza melodia maxima]|nr:hypothetical protein EK904_004934 [Melospiza melodia maxima]
MERSQPPPPPTLPNTQTSPQYLGLYRAKFLLWIDLGPPSLGGRFSAPFLNPCRVCLSSAASDEDNKPLPNSQTSLDGTIKQQESDDSLVDYGEGGEGQFNEDGSFIGQYTVKKDKEETEGNESSEATSPVNAIYSLA